MPTKKLQINIPISKIDEEQRIVTGIATSEMLDSQGDIVDYEASKKAFSEWPGNIREMHGPVAIGKGIDVQFDDASKQVIVSAKISESADGENSWIKVKEKILTGFSIGGKVFQVVKDKANDGAQRITDYALSELSLVDNPANPEAELLMVKSMSGGLQRVEKEVTKSDSLPEAWWVNQFMNKSKGTQMEKGGIAVVDSDPRDATATTVTEATPVVPKKGGTLVPKKVYSVDGKSYTQKSVYDAQTALSLASQLAYLIMCESDEPDQVADLVSAFNSIRDFAGKELAEGDDFDTSGYMDAIELANKAINLRKEKFMAEKDLEKSNVVAGVERDETATVVADDRPANVKETAADATVEAPAEEVATNEEIAEAPVEEAKEDEAKDVVAEAAAEEAAPVAEAGEVVAPEAATEEEKANTATDLVKSVETLLAKLNDGQGNVELKKAYGDIQKTVGEVAKSVDALKDRIEALEKQPLPTKGQRYQVVTKGDEGEVDTEVKDLLKRQDELIANPSDAKPGEMFELSQKLRKANLGETIKIN